ncbi:lipopolysaccharide assembly protein LapA domain-containing protein [uncultured Corynebacterium sp.]|uniref:LapA family protein n=1 Tax=uncultured Corynebacterium sp. TaxID=159447 RepID=UPI002805A0EA|nr:lipopolysaccharide assembly protein LapA domain-containing protein [uncultured Corynebacterium sp.]
MTNPENSPEEFRTTAPADEPLTDYTAEAPATEGSVEPVPTTPNNENKNDGKVKGSFAASTWIALIVGFLLLIVLIIFILQNQHQVPLNFLNWSVQFPAGVTYLICAIAGALIMALVGGWRMFELRRQVRKQARR